MTPPAPDRSAVSRASALSGVTSALRIWPPSSPISIRTKLSSATRNHLRENAVDGIGMDERDLEAEETDAWHLVDELSAGVRELVERRPQVVGRERDVVHPRPSSREEAADRRVLAGRREQLDPAVAEEERRGFDALLHERRAMLDACVEELLVRRDRLVEVVDGEAEVMNALHAHPRDATHQPK